MNNLSPFQKLDLMLSFLDNANPMYIEDFQKKLNIQTNESRFEIEMVLNKLVKDGYSYKTDAKIEHQLPENLRYLVDQIFYYKITFEGEYFKSSGGYQELHRREIADKIYEQTLQSYPKKLNVLTFWLALGTVGLLLIEGIKFLNEIYHWWQ